MHQRDYFGDKNVDEKDHHEDYEGNEAMMLRSASVEVGGIERELGGEQVCEKQQNSRHNEQDRKGARIVVFEQFESFV